MQRPWEPDLLANNEAEKGKRCRDSITGLGSSWPMKHDVSASGLDCYELQNRWLTPPAEILSGSALILSGSALRLTQQPRRAK